VSRFGDANHPPRVRLTGSPRAIVRPGDDLPLDVSTSIDPDGDRLVVEWFLYPEAGTNHGASPVIEAADSATALLRVPVAAMSGTIHCIAVVSDTGSPSLTRYARVVVEVAVSEDDPRAGGR